MRKEDKYVFGSLYAERDALLPKCAVPVSDEGSANSIISGRWGTGKSAQLFLANAELMAVLPRDDREIWYLPEKSLMSTDLVQIFHDSEQRHELTANLQPLWRAEIVRRAAMALCATSRATGGMHGPHWEFVDTVSSSVHLGDSVWKRLKLSLVALRSMNKEQRRSFRGLSGSFENVFTESAFQHVKCCFRDLSKRSLAPVIGIEPLESPGSKLEQSGSLAQAVVDSLMEVYLNDFLWCEDDDFRLRIALPWHRRKKLEISNPQKIEEDLLELRWDSSSLRQFIAERIFRGMQDRRSLLLGKARADPWGTLFPTRITNTYTAPQVVEDSFSYVLRHTHYRPRQLLAIANRTVQLCSSAIGRSVDDVVRGVGGVRVHESHLRQAVARHCQREYDLLLREGERRYPSLRRLIAEFRGIRIPFDEDELRRRAQKAGTGPRDAANILWETGFLGVGAKCESDPSVGRLKALLLEGTYRRFKNASGQIFHKWYFFEYNTRGSAETVRDSFQDYAEVNSDYVLHPVTFEDLLPRLPSTCPVGA